jgi:hypothetical protein
MKANAANVGVPVLGKVGLIGFDTELCCDPKRKKRPGRSAAERYRSVPVMHRSAQFAGWGS